MKKRVRFADFMVHFDISVYVQFEVYPIQEWEEIMTGKKGFDYIDKEKEPDAIKEFEEGKCLKKMEGSYCWRGVWEGRLYFTDVEYWGEELLKLSELYNKIEIWCKKFIKERNPERLYDE